MGIFQGRSKGSWFGFVADAGSGHGKPERHRKDNRGDGRVLLVRDHYKNLFRVL
jgi:hypothetical protein